jgi:hypothetical protein
MKKFDELTDQQKSSAVQFIYNSFIAMLCEDGVCPNLGSDALEDKLTEFAESAGAEADRLSTPWFMNEILADLIESDKETYEKMLRVAEESAKVYYYKEDGDMVVSI